ncbi:MAG: hypothetical protein AAFX55_11350 [Bacteroidota bacterium]
MSLYQVIKVSETKIELNFEPFQCDDIGLYVIGKYPRLKYGNFINSEGFDWRIHTVATIRLTLLNLINRGIIDVYQVQKRHKYAFNLISRSTTDYYFKVVDLQLDKDWFSVLVHDTINEVNRSKAPSLFNYIKSIFDKVIYTHNNYRNPYRAFILQIIRKYAKEFDWIELIKKKKFLDLLDDYEIKVEEIYIPRISMQHKALVDLDNSLYHSNMNYLNFTNSLETEISNTINKRKNRNRYYRIEIRL